MTTEKHREAARETMRKNATGHGLAAGETKDTYYVCKGVWRSRRTIVDWPDLPSFVQGVLAEIGPRPEPDDEGTWQLFARGDYSYLLDLNGVPDSRVDPTMEESLANPDAGLGDVFKPGHLEWKWRTRKVRRRDRPKSDKPLPETFVESEWGHPDRERQKRKRRDRDEYRRAERAEGTYRALPKG